MTICIGLGSKVQIEKNILRKARERWQSLKNLQTINTGGFVEKRELYALLVGSEVATMEKRMDIT